MAFYISRLDDNGEEIERLTSTISFPSRMSGSSTSWKTCGSRSSQSKFANCAVYIERLGDNEIKHYCELCHESSSRNPEVGGSESLNCGANIESRCSKCRIIGASSRDYEIVRNHSLDGIFSKITCVGCKIGECSSLNRVESIEELKDELSEANDVNSSLTCAKKPSSAPSEADSFSGEIALLKKQSIGCVSSISIMLECVDDDLKCVQKYCDISAMFSIPSVLYIPSKRCSEFSLQQPDDGNKTKRTQNLMREICPPIKSKAIPKEESHKIQENPKPKEQVERKVKEERRQRLAKVKYQQWLETKACQQFPSGKKCRKHEKPMSLKNRQEEETWERFKKWLDKECRRIKEQQKDIN